jgi:hypothetical protein
VLRVLLVVTAIVMAAVLHKPASADRIGNDSGGVLIEYALRVAKANEQGRRIEFHSRCASACTLYLSLPKERLCIGKGASFAFHAPYGRRAKSSARAKAFFQSKYPDWVRTWINRNGGLSSKSLIMPGTYAVRFLNGC